MPPVAVREAATVLVVRDGEHGVEVLLLLRTMALEFSPGAHVFPGGAVDVADRSAAALAVSDGHTDASASDALGIPYGGLGYYLAAVRECFEEAGILLGADTATVAAVTGRRRAIGGSADAFFDAVAAAGGRLRLDSLVPFGHWITPEGAPRRYDTRFFITAAPSEQIASPDHHEAVDAGWQRPCAVLDAHARGEVELILPTQRSLEAIADAATVAQLWPVAAP